MTRILTFQNTFILFLLLLNIIIFNKLHFFLPLISGNSLMLDFDTYYHLVADMINNVNPYSVGYMTTLGPPIVFSYYLPFSFLNLASARALSTLINIFSGFVLSAILAHKLNHNNRPVAFLLLSAILFSAFPTRFSLEMGQPNLLLALIVTVIIFSKNNGITAFLISLLITIKTYFILVVFSLYKNDKYFVARVMLYLLIILFIYSSTIKPELYLYYSKSVFPTIASSQNNISTLDYYNQSLTSTFSRFGFEIINKYIYVLFLISGIVIIYLSSYLELAIILSVILSIVSWQHYYVVLFPIYIKALTINSTKIRSSILLSVLLFFWWVEFPWLHNTNKNLVTGILASHYFLSALLLSIYLFVRNRLNMSRPRYIPYS